MILPNKKPKQQGLRGLRGLKSLSHYCVMSDSDSDLVSVKSCEINSISEQLDKVLSNGKIISEKTDNHQEKDLVTSTTSNLSDQIGSLKQLIQDKKNSANDAIDAWQRFLQVHSAMKTWCEEKDAFLEKPFSFTNLSAAKLKVQDYNTTIKSVKNADKNIVEMEFSTIAIE